MKQITILSILTASAVMTASSAVVIFDEDFDSLAVGTTTATAGGAGSNNQVPGSQFASQNASIATVIASTPAFTALDPLNANVVELRDAGNNFDGFRFELGSLPTASFSPGDTLRITFDYEEVTQALTALQFRYRSGGVANLNLDLTLNETDLGGGIQRFTAEFEVPDNDPLTSTPRGFFQGFTPEAANTGAVLGNFDNFIVEVVPEPSSTLLLGLSGLVLACRRRR